MYKVFLTSSYRTLIFFVRLLDNLLQVIAPSGELSVLTDLFEEGIKILPPPTLHTSPPWHQVHARVMRPYTGKHLTGSLKGCREQPVIHLPWWPTKQDQHTVEVRSELRISPRKRVATTFQEKPASSPQWPRPLGAWLQRHYYRSLGLAPHHTQK